MGTDRITVHTSIAPAFTQVLQNRVGALSKSAPGPPTISSTASKQRLAHLVTSALSAGARLIAGPPTQPSSPATFLPTILADVPLNSPLYHEEAFGPLVALSTFSTDAEAIAFANSTAYGLHGAIFSRDLRRALGIAKRLEVGAVHINSMTVHDEPALPMGGVKGSGWGRFNAGDGMEEFLVRKVVTWDD